jgi:hypothetical protein
MRPPETKTQLPPPAQFIESEGGNGADQREAGGERKEQVNEVVQGQLGYYKSADRIDNAEKDHMGWNRSEVFNTLRQRILDIHHPDLPDHWKGLARVRADRHVQVGHGCASVKRHLISRAASSQWRAEKVVFQTVPSLRMTGRRSSNLARRPHSGANAAVADQSTPRAGSLT